MRCWYVILSLANFVFVPAYASIPAYANTPAEIRVRVAHLRPLFQIRAENLVVEKQDARSGVFQIKFTPKTNRWEISGENVLKIFTADRIALSAKTLNLDGQAIGGEAYLVPNHDHVDLVERVNIETYLLGVLFKEMPETFPLEAFRAQAVASRTYALKRMEQNRLRHYDVEATVLDQVYVAKGQISDKVRSAVKSTRGEVLKNEQGEIATVFFHSDCGGHTEAANEVWSGNEADTHSVADPACAFHRFAKWNFAIPKWELNARLKVPLHMGDASIVKILDQEVSESGRKKLLKIVLDDNTTRILSGQELRNILGFDKIKSTLFEFEKKADQFVFRGQGLGHGVGMCQWGAQDLAQHGAHFDKILSHYFPGSTLEHYQNLLSKN